MPVLSHLVCLAAMVLLAGVAVRARREARRARELQASNVELEREISSRTQGEAETRRRADFELVVGRLATGLVNCAVERIDADIDRAVEELGRFAGAERADVVLFANANGGARVLSEWCAPGAESRRTVLEQLGGGIPLQSIDWFTERLEAGKLVYLEDLGAVADHVVTDEHRALVNHVRSLIAVPLEHGGDTLGWIGLTASRPRPWDSETRTLVRLVAELVANALDRKESETSLRESDERFRQVTSNTDQLIWIWQLDPREVIYVSPAFETIWREPRTTGIKRPMEFVNAINEEDQARVFAMYTQAERERAEATYRIRLADGTERWVMTRAFPIPDADGNPYRIGGVTSDITEQVEAERRLTFRAEFEGLIARLAAGLIDVADEGLDAVVEQALGEIAEFLDLDRASIFESLGGEHYRCSHQWSSPRIADVPRPPEGTAVNEFPWLTSTLARREMLRIETLDDIPAEASSERDTLERIGVRSRIQLPLATSRGVIGALTFVSMTEERTWDDELTPLLELAAVMFANALERKRAGRRIGRYQHKLRGLASEVSLAEERERRRIAAELHDRTIQSLGLCRLKLSALRDGGAQNQAISTAHADALDETCALLESTISEMRSLVFELASPVLYELGFEPSVEWLAEHVGSMYGVRFEIDASANGNGTAPHAAIDTDVAVVLFQSVRELMINVGKHAGVESAGIRLGRRDGSVVVEVSDDGVGFDVDAIGPRLAECAGFGLFAIRERCEQLGGRATVHSEPGAGTRVVIEVPDGDPPTTGVTPQGMSKT